MKFPPWIRGLRASFIFMSRLPLGGFPYSDADFRAAPAYFPIVGSVLGLLGATLLYLSAPLGAEVAAALCILTTVYASGAFHEDGLADTADALGGAHSRKKLHEILKDSRIGTYGGCALFFSLFLRTTLLAQLLRESVFLSCVLVVWMHTLSRVVPVFLMASLPSASGEGAKGSAVAAGGTWSRAWIALLFGILATFGAHRLGLPLPLFGVQFGVLIALTLALRFRFKKAAGGYTGDFLGASEQLSELAILLTTLILYRNVGLSY